MRILLLVIVLVLGKLKHLPGFHTSGQYETELQRIIKKNVNNTTKLNVINKNRHNKT